MARNGIEAKGPRRVLCYPRILGFVFNPISVWFCDDVTGRLKNGCLQPADLSARQREALWVDLGNTDGAQAYQALWTLIATPAHISSSAKSPARVGPSVPSSEQSKYATHSLPTVTNNSRG